MVAEDTKGVGNEERLNNEGEKNGGA